MLQNGQTDYEEIHYEEIVPKLENVVSNGKSETVFRYAKNSPFFLIFVICRIKLCLAIHHV